MLHRIRFEIKNSYSLFIFWEFGGRTIVDERQKLIKDIFEMSYACNRCGERVFPTIKSISNDFNEIVMESEKYRAGFGLNRGVNGMALCLKCSDALHNCLTGQ